MDKPLDYMSSTESNCSTVFNWRALFCFVLMEEQLFREAMMRFVLWNTHQSINSMWSMSAGDLEGDSIRALFIREFGTESDYVCRAGPRLTYTRTLSRSSINTVKTWKSWREPLRHDKGFLIEHLANGLTLANVIIYKWAFSSSPAERSKSDLASLLNW